MGKGMLPKKQGQFSNVEVRNCVSVFKDEALLLLVEKQMPLTRLEILAGLKKRIPKGDQKRRTFWVPINRIYIGYALNRALGILEKAKVVEYVGAEQGYDGSRYKLKQV